VIVELIKRLFSRISQNVHVCHTDEKASQAIENASEGDTIIQIDRLYPAPQRRRYVGTVDVVFRHDLNSLAMREIGGSPGSLIETSAIRRMMKKLKLPKSKIMICPICRKRTNKWWVANVTKLCIQCHHISQRLFQEGNGDAWVELFGRALFGPPPKHPYESVVILDSTTDIHEWLQSYLVIAQEGGESDPRETEA
jgi:hypothetical protein